METLQFTLSIPEQKAEVVFEAFANSYKYTPTITNEDGEEVANPETVDVFTKRKVIEYITEVTTAYLIGKAKLEAEEVAKQQIDLSGIE